MTGHVHLRALSLRYPGSPRPALADVDLDLPADALVAVVGAVLVIARPQWLLPSGAEAELDWPLWGQVLGSAYVWWAVAVVAATLASLKQMVAGRDAETSST